jgi:hypothetical protein
MRVRRVVGTTLVTGVATVFGFGLIGPGASVLAGPSAEYAVRDDDVREVAVVQAADDDDDNSNSKSNSKGSGVSRDHTNSRFSKVSRNRDKSRGDLTRDLTRDGKNNKLKRDWSDNRTNDRSRNDTR